jgi:hypothetical protein
VGWSFCDSCNDPRWPAARSSCFGFLCIYKRGQVLDYHTVTLWSEAFERQFTGVILLLRVCECACSGRQ